MCKSQLLRLPEGTNGACTKWVKGVMERGEALWKKENLSGDRKNENCEPREESVGRGE